MIGKGLNKVISLVNLQSQPSLVSVLHLNLKRGGFPRDTLSPPSCNQLAAAAAAYRTHTHTQFEL